MLSSRLISGKKEIDIGLDTVFQSKPPASIITPPQATKKRKPTPEPTSPAKRQKPAKELLSVKEITSKKKTKSKGKGKNVIEVEEDGAVPEKNAPDSDAESSTSNLVHESVQKQKNKAKAPPPPSDETPEQRDRRTIFVGNLPVQVAEKRPLLKQLKKHILSHLPTAKIESVRFRSVPFQNPTAKLPEEELDAKTKTKTKTKTPSSHDLERVSSWKDNKNEGEDNDRKKFLTPSEKKRIAFINRELHSEGDSVNAYIVFAHSTLPLNRPSNLPPPQHSMDPFEAAAMAIQKCNATMFMERTIRVDAVVKSADTSSDPKLSIFVGSLDFATKEEDLRVFFEGLISAERGPCEDGHWVTSVRIIRDRDTQLGKGFGYVQFSGRDCVDEVLAMEETKIKFAKRKLRVQRCKTLPGASKQADVPKGDPNLGEKLAHLSKEERKQAKSADSDRIARRMAKKKARNVMAAQGVKVQGKTKSSTRKTHSGNKK